MTEFTVHLPNRPGSLADLAERLAAAGVNIEALAAIGMNESGTVKLIVDDEAATRRMLEHHGLLFEERRVITTMLPHRPGSVAAMTRRLADAGINIDAMYLLRTTPEGLEFAVAVDDDTQQRAS
ncbi:MAG: ACT domain-containing protein [Acidobacteria bacterium]|nr:ACT domain-containing protein [Acidobacteriota bacterium]